jgi:hypothetical protein
VAADEQQVFAFVGSRRFAEPYVIERAMRRLMATHGDSLFIVTGDARGADRMSYETARLLGIPRDMKRIDPDQPIPEAFFYRNGKIIAATNAGLMAFYAPGPLSHGTNDSVQRALHKRLPVHAYQDGAWITPDVLLRRIAEEARDGEPE